MSEIFRMTETTILGFWVPFLTLVGIIVLTGIHAHLTHEDSDGR